MAGLRDGGRARLRLTGSPNRTNSYIRDETVLAGRLPGAARVHLMLSVSSPVPSPRRAAPDPRPAATSGIRPGRRPRGPRLPRPAAGTRRAPCGWRRRWLGLAAIAAYLVIALLRLGLPLPAGVPGEQLAGGGAADTRRPRALRGAGGRLRAGRLPAAVLRDLGRGGQRARPVLPAAAARVAGVVAGLLRGAGPAGRSARRRAPPPGSRRRACWPRPTSSRPPGSTSPGSTRCSSRSAPPPCTPARWMRRTRGRRRDRAAARGRVPHQAERARGRGRGAHRAGVRPAAAAGRGPPR